jgi:hypothetical protein
MSLALAMFGYGLPLVALLVGDDGEIPFALPAAVSLLMLADASILGCFAAGLLGTARNVQPLRSALGVSVALLWSILALIVLEH